LKARTQTSPSPPKPRGNDLDGRRWTRFSISVWSDIRWTKEELALRHPAMFPVMLVERLIQCFTRESERAILDPFLGSGSTLVAARNLSRIGIGFEVYSDFIRLARERAGPDAQIHQADAREIARHLESDSIDFCVTSPPYWDILTQKHTADYKATRHYGDGRDDLGRIAGYDLFLEELARVFAGVYQVLRPGKYCVVNVMDLRKANRFFPLHADLAARLEQIGFVFDDLILWDRRHEYNSLRPLGYPYVFRVNKTHEYLLIFQKPRPASPPRGRRP
jgi:DNA modification methylase